jgi:hypothetical protein
VSRKLVAVTTRALMTCATKETHMASRPPYPDTDDTDMGPDQEPTTGPPRWVKVFAVIGVVVVLLVVVVMLASDGQHGPWRHAPGSAPGVEAPEGQAPGDRAPPEGDG